MYGNDGAEVNISHQQEVFHSYAALFIPTDIRTTINGNRWSNNKRNLAFAV